MIKNAMTVYDDKGNKIEVEVVASFKIKEYNKEYIIYTLNDDGVSETVNMYISQVDFSSNPPKFTSIPEEEIKMVLSYYDFIRDHVGGTR